MKSQKELQYNNIYNILTENVAKAKVRLAHLAESPDQGHKQDQETLERILRQKKEYEQLLKVQQHQRKTKEAVRVNEQRRIERAKVREAKLTSIRE